MDLEVYVDLLRQIEAQDAGESSKQARRIARFIDLRRSQVRQGTEGYLSRLDYWLKRSSNE